MSLCYLQEGHPDKLVHGLQIYLKNEISSATVVHHTFFFQAIPSQASVFLWHAYLDSIVTTDIMKSFVLRLSLHWCIPCSSLRSRPLNQVGRANSNDAQIISSFQEWLTFLSTLLPGKATPHTFSCHVRWVAFSSVLPQRFVPDLYKLVFYLFTCLSPPYACEFSQDQTKSHS